MNRKYLTRTLCLVALAALPLVAGADDEARDRAIRRMLNTPAGGADASGRADPGPRADRSTEPMPDTPLEPQLGQLVADGPATPEQISLYLPLDNGLPPAANARVRYRDGDGDGDSWMQAHPLLLIRPDYAQRGSKLRSAFAGVITGLAPNRRYRIEVTVQVGEQSAVRTLEARTRALPGPAPAATKTVNPGDSGAQIQSLFNSAAAGDVILIRNGTYQVDQLTIQRSGTESRPIYIRGESRDGTRLLDRTGRVLYLVKASHLVIENLTLEGSGTDGGTAAGSEGIRAWSGYTPQDVTVRGLGIVGVDKGIVGEGDMAGFLVYDNTLVGNNVFRKDVIESNVSWNDDGIRVPGRGHAVFNNTLSGFGDALAMSAGVDNVGVHFYRNRILFTCDDAYEGDYGTRNLSFYDNRIQNAMTMASFDPVFGGPAFVFRNVAINVGRQPYKLNNTNTGMLFYNNTIVRIPGYRSGANWGWLQSDNGSLRAWTYRNNLLLFDGPGKLLALESSGNNPIDFDHNAWYPDGMIWWTRSGGSFRSLSAARAGLRATSPLFGDSRQRHAHDLVAEKNPFEVPIRFEASYDVPVTTIYEPKLSASSALRNAGAIIPGITDGYSGERPDIGAVISGRPAVRVGDRTR